MICPALVDHCGEPIGMIHLCSNPPNCFERCTLSEEEEDWPPDWWLFDDLDYEKETLVELFRPYGVCL